MPHIKNRDISFSDEAAFFPEGAAAPVPVLVYGPDSTNLTTPMGVRAAFHRTPQGPETDSDQTLAGTI